MADRRGTPVWFELATADPDAAGRFYATLADWRIAPSPMPEHGGYRVAAAPDGGGVAGMMTPPEGSGTPGWSVYFAVDDVDDAAARIAALGGAVGFGPADIPHVGRFAVATDPQGVGFTVMRTSAADASGAFAQGDDTIGHGVWVELATPDPDAALDFYGALFGWSRQGALPMGAMGDYVFVGSGDDDRPGAMMSSTTTGAPARWNWYVHVADIDAGVAKATVAGATLIQGPDEIPGGSFSANLTDPEGWRIGIVGKRKAA